MTMETVILLHGISRTTKIMRPLERALLESGFQVRNVAYPSTQYSIEELAEYIYEQIKVDCQNHQKIHFVGHSMGALLVRLLIFHHRPAHLGRVVMLGPPNQGSRVVDFLKHFVFYKKFFGPAGQQIGTNSEDIYLKLPPADYECGVIAADRSSNPFFSWALYFGVRDDGRVSVEETKLEGMSDHVVVHATHAGLLRNVRAIQLVKKFLLEGSF